MKKINTALLSLLLLIFLHYIFFGSQTTIPEAEENISLNITEEYTGNLSGNVSNETDCSIGSSDQRDKCILEHALLSNQPELCMNLSNNGYINRCFRDFSRKTGDVSYCYEITEDDEYMDGCIMELAMESGDGKLCHWVISSFNRDTCFRDVAVKTKEGVYCSEIADKDYKIFCENELVQIAVAEEDLSICEDLASREYCIEAIQISRQ